MPDINWFSHTVTELLGVPGERHVLFNVGEFVGTFVGRSVGIGTAVLQKAPAPPPGLITCENAAGTTSRDHLFAHSQAMLSGQNPFVPSCGPGVDGK